MSSQFQRKYQFKRILRKWRKNKKLVLSVLTIVAYTGIVVYTNHMQDKRFIVDPAAYDTLLQLIAKAESNNNYNAYYGNPANTELKFTEMSMSQVLQWQSDFVQRGSPSSAVGKYQFLNTTLTQLIEESRLGANQKFDPKTQDKLAIALLERRGSEKYANKEISSEEFAANLAREWAALPRVTGDDPTNSYYAGDGLNTSRVSVDEILKAIEPIRTE